MITDKILNIRGMADALHCSERQVENGIKDGKIPATKALTGKPLSTEGLLTEAVRAFIAKTNPVQQ